MYQEFYKLRSDPFAMPTDKRIIYYSKPFLEVIYYFKYNFKTDESILLVTGDYGSGKTTFCRRLVKVLASKKDINCLYISTPNCNYQQILIKIASHLNITAHNSDDLQEAIFHYYESTDKYGKFYVVIDDANELDLSTLTKLRYLTDFNQDGYYPFRLVLFAHTSFLDTLKKPELIPFNQRIRRRTRLEPLNLEETKKYIQFRLSKASSEAGPSFTDGAMERIHEISWGNPRSIHTICDTCLILGAMEGLRTIDAFLVGRAKDMAGDSPGFEQRVSASLPPVGRGREGERRGEARSPRKDLPPSFPGKGGEGAGESAVLRVSRGERSGTKGRKRNWGFKAFILLVVLTLAAMIIGILFDVRAFLGGLL